MLLIRFDCQGFRCLDEIHFEPAPGTNIIRGKNAQGKTSLLEAILFTATSKSQRTNVESDLVTRSREGFRTKLDVRRRDREVTIEAHWWKGAKRFKVNGVSQTRVSDILGKVSVILFTPEDIALVKGSAAVRRQFLDMELSQVHLPYLSALQDYRQVLRQRNEVLRTSNPDTDLLEVWDEQLARHGGQLIEDRRAYVEQLAELAARAHAVTAGGEQLEIRYAPDIASADAVAETLKRSRTSDLRRGITTRGPHRDDIDIFIGGTPARSHASQGQQKSSSLALKLAQLDLVFARTGEYPILMLDEVLSELDASRARHLFDAIPAEVQCLVTTTELNPEKQSFAGSCTNFTIENGRLSSA